MRYFHPLCGVVAQAANDWEKGVLPVQGGVFSQPARLVAGVRLVQRARAHCQHLLALQRDMVSGVVGKFNGGTE